VVAGTEESQDAIRRIPPGLLQRVGRPVQRWIGAVLDAHEVLLAVGPRHPASPEGHDTGQLQELVLAPVRKGQTTMDQVVQDGLRHLQAPQAERPQPPVQVIPQPPQSRLPVGKPDPAGDLINREFMREERSEDMEKPIRDLRLAVGAGLSVESARRL